MLNANRPEGTELLSNIPRCLCMTVGPETYLSETPGQAAVWEYSRVADIQNFRLVGRTPKHPWTPIHRHARSNALFAG